MRVTSTINPDGKGFIPITPELTLIKEKEKITIKLFERELVLTYLQAMHVRNTISMWANEERRRIQGDKHAPRPSIPANKIR